MAKPEPSHDWRELAEKAAHETDSKKLMALVRELTDALDRESLRKFGGMSNSTHDSTSAERSGNEGD